MIPRTEPVFQQENWKKELANAITQPLELLRELQLEQSDLAHQLDAMPDFRLRVPRAFVRNMKKGDANDPLLLQVLPQSKERVVLENYQLDPVSDKAAEVVPGVLHKYHGRALLVTTGACAVHCRYCFRRHFPYNESNPKTNAWFDALEYIRNDESIHEVLLSGGDPLSLDDRKLTALFTAISQIQHVKRVRIHTRLPVVLPSRITEELLALLHHTTLKVVMVIHANHVNELSAEVEAACLTLHENKVTLLNQSVLLRGINDHTDALIDLSERLFEINVQPYYLHLLDPVQGAAHFDVSASEAITLMAQVRSKLPGYLVPQLVKEIAGEPSKTPLHEKLSTHV